MLTYRHLHPHLHPALNTLLFIWKGSETGNSFRITAISKGRYAHSEFTDSSPEVSLLNTKRAAG